MHSKFDCVSVNFVRTQHSNHMFLNKYKHTVNIKAFRTLPFPALISLLVTINITDIVEGRVTKVTDAIKVVGGKGYWGCRDQGKA